MISVRELQSMHDSGQPARTERLLTILGQFGFETRRSRSGTSHIFVWHPDYPEVGTATIVAESKRKIYQKNVAKLCMAVQDILSETEVETGETNDIAHIVQEPARSLEIPDAFEAIRGRKNPGLFLRHKEFPQIAANISNYNDAEELKGICAELETQACTFSDRLNAAEKEANYNVHRHPNGAIVLSHLDYPIQHVIYPFTPRLKNDNGLQLLDDAIADAELERENYLEAIEGIFARYELEEIDSNTSNVRKFIIRRAFDKNAPDTVRLELSENGFLSYYNFVKAVQAVQDTRWKDYKKNLRQHFGFVTTITEGGNIHGIQPQTGVEFTVPAPTHLSSIEDDIKRYNFADSEDRNLIDSDLSSKYKEREAACKTVIDALEESRAILEPLTVEAGRLARQLDYAKIEGNFKYGEPATLSCRYQGHKFQVPVVPTTGGTRKDPQMIFSAEAIDVLKRGMSTAPSFMITDNKKPSTELNLSDFDVKPPSAPTLPGLPKSTDKPQSPPFPLAGFKKK